MANAFFYSNIAVPTTLSGNINNSVTSATVADTTGWPSVPFVIAIDFQTANEELCKVTNNAAGTLTIVRGFSGTVAVSHSTGAAVRHVWNAQDGTDFRTHEAATGAVHGITGSFVGTTDVQTLTNKTLTAPTVNSGVFASGGSFAGTFTGTPTFSGALTLSGTPNITNGAALTGTFSGTPTFSGALTFTGGPTFNTLSALYTRAAATDPAIRVRLDADSQSRLIIQADGKHVLGSGAATGDTDLFRAGVNILGSTSTIQTAPTVTTLDGFSANLPTSTTGDLLNLRVNSAIQAAMGSDGAFRIYGGNSPASYTPTVANGGTVTWTTRTGVFWKIGKMVFVVVYLVVNAAGSGAGIVMVDMPSSVERTRRQAITVHAETIGANGNATSAIRGGECVFFTGGTGATSDRLRVDNGTNNEQNILGADLLAGGLITIQGIYQEA